MLHNIFQDEISVFISKVRICGFFFFFFFFLLPYICSQGANSSRFSSPHSLSLWSAWLQLGCLCNSCCFRHLSSLLTERLLRPRAARKMFPKRKLDESRSGSESQKEESGAKEEQGQRNKRPRVESSPGAIGTLSLRFTAARGKSWWEGKCCQDF